MTGIGRSRQTSAPRRVFALLALLAMFLQTFVVQTHVHSTPIAPLVACEQTADGRHADQHVAATDSHQIFCAICEALAANPTTLPDAATASIAVDPAGEAALVALAIAPLTRSYSWQSRAPPTRLGA
jgi:hypothetical protein